MSDEVVFLGISDYMHPVQRKADEVEIAALQEKIKILEAAYHSLWIKHGDLQAPTIDEIKKGITKRVGER